MTRKYQPCHFCHRMANIDFDIELLKYFSQIPLQNSQVWHSRADRALLHWRKEYGRLWVPLGVQCRPPYTVYVYWFWLILPVTSSVTITCTYLFTGDPLHSRAACTQPCNVNTHSRAYWSPGARLCEQWGHGCVNNGARLCANARLCRGSPVLFTTDDNRIRKSTMQSSVICLYIQVISSYLSPSLTNFVLHMMTSSNGNIFRVTGHLCGEFTGPWRIPCTKASDAELKCFLWSVSE